MSLFGLPGTSTTGGKISSGQTTLIQIGVVLAVTIFVLPGRSAAVAGSDSYLSPAVATLPSILQIVVIYLLAKRFDWTSPYEYLPRLLGPVLGRAVSLFFVFLLLFLAATADQEITKVVGAVFMPLTPLVVFVMLSTLTAAYLAWLGHESFGRLAQLMLPALLLVLAWVWIGASGNVDYGYVLPILHRGWRPVLHGAGTAMAMRSEAGMTLAFLIPHMRNPRQALRSGVMASCVIGLALALNVITVIGLVSPPETVRLTMPTLTAARMVQATRGIEHLEFLVIGPWLLALTLKVALFVALAAEGWRSVAGTRTWRSYVLPMAAIAGLMGSWIYPNPQALAEMISDGWPGFALAANYILPVVLLLLAVILRRRGRAHG